MCRARAWQKIFPSNDPNAEELFNEADLESWVGTVLFKPYKPDR